MKTSRKRLKRLKEVAAYNVGQFLDCEKDAESLNLPKTLEILVKKFVNTYSGDYIIDSGENWNRLSRYSCDRFVFLHPCSTSRNLSTIIHSVSCKTFPYLEKWKGYSSLKKDYETYYRGEGEPFYYNSIYHIFIIYLNIS